MAEIDFHFDFRSPYSFLAFAQRLDFVRERLAADAKAGVA